MQRDHKRALVVLEERERRLNRSPRSWPGLRAVVVKFLESIGTTRLKLVRRAEVEAYLAQLQARNLSAHTQAHHLGRLRNFFKTLVAEGLVASDPTHGLRVRTRVKPPRLFLSQDEVERLFVAAAKGSDARLALRDRASLELLYGTGVRALELCRVRVLDVDLVRGSLRVRPAKGGAPRTVPLPPRALPWLERYLQEARPMLLKRDEDPGTLLLTRRGRGLSVGALQHALAKRVGVAAGIEGVHPHALRHALATHLAEAGVDLRTIQIVLGHSSLNMTARYVHGSLKALRKAVAKLDS